MAKAIRVHETGGPEVLRLEEYDPGRPGPGEALVEQKVIGLNFIDVYQRMGLYPLEKPFTPGGEGAGVVLEVGEGVHDLKPGDRVAYVVNGGGAYAQHRRIAADRLVKVPDGISDEQAGSMMLKGLTAWYLLRRTFPVKPGTTILYHAAAGGVGLIVCQWAKHIGATVIGTVGSDEKAKLAGEHGCDHPIVYTRENFVDRVKEITGGKMLPVVYDSVGKDTFMDSLKCLRPRGLMVSFGQSSGKIAPIDTGILAAHGSLYLTRPTLFSYAATRADLEEVSGNLFDVVKRGIVKIEVTQTFPLRNAAEAHRALEGRKTTGSVVLTV